MSELVKETARTRGGYIEEAILNLFIAEAARLGFIVAVNEFCEGIACITMYDDKELWSE